METENTIKIAELMEEFQSNEWGNEQFSIKNILDDDFECSDCELDEICHELESRKEIINAPANRYFPSC